MESRRKELIADVLAVFKDVTRIGGVSWSQTYVLDDYGSEAELAFALDHDLDLTWMELARHGPWKHGSGSHGGWSFLDPIGARYYLAAALLLDLEHGVSADHEFSLTHGPTDAYWCLLNDEQKRVVAEYLAWKRDIEGLRGNQHEHRKMKSIFQSGWNNCLD
jgi:hypothetical protein